MKKKKISKKEKMRNVLLSTAEKNIRKELKRVYVD